MAPRPSLIDHGRLPFLVTTMLGRQPAAMVQLGLLMYVASSGLGLDLGGMMVAAVGLGTAIGATIIGRLVDRFGPLPVVVVATLVQLSGMFLILQLTPSVAEGSLGSWALLAAGLVVGCANPQVGPIARSHWSHIARERREPALIRHALGYEGAVDELSFIVGPIVAGLLVSFLGPAPALWALMGIIVVGQGAFVIYLIAERGSWGRVMPQSAASGRIPVGLLIGPMVTLLAVGITFGATQTALTALNEARDTQHLTGIIYGCVGAGSMVSSLLVPRLPSRVTVDRRLLVGAVGLLLGGLGMLFLPGAFVAGLLGVLIGLSVGIILVTGFTRAEQVAPASRMASAMTLLATCLTLGVSIGAASAGQLADDLVHAFYPLLAAGLLALLATFLISRGDAD